MMEKIISTNKTVVLDLRRQRDEQEVPENDQLSQHLLDWGTQHSIIRRNHQHQQTLKRNNTNNNEVYTDKSKSKENKLCFAALLFDITRIGTLPKGVHTNN